MIVAEVEAVKIMWTEASILFATNCCGVESKAIVYSKSYLEWSAL